MQETDSRMTRYSISSDTLKKLTINACWICEKEKFEESTDQKMQQCAKCHIALYCSRGCQRKDWAKHKVECKSLPGFKSKLDEIYNPLKIEEANKWRGKKLIHLSSAHIAELREPMTRPEWWGKMCLNSPSATGIELEFLENALSHVK